MKGHDPHPNGQDAVRIGFVLLEDKQDKEERGEDDADEEQHGAKIRSREQGARGKETVREQIQQCLNKEY